MSENKEKHKSKIGGQALIEGVMMNGIHQSAMACRLPDGTIDLEVWNTRNGKDAPWYKKVPFVRGIFNFVSSLILGYKCLMKSAEKQMTDDEEEEELSKLDFIKLYVTKNSKNHSSVISFNINGVHPHDVASILDSNGVCVRSGNHCAQPLLRYLGVDSTCRASFSIYNTKEDVDNLVEALKKSYKMFEKYINKE